MNGTALPGVAGGDPGHMLPENRCHGLGGAFAVVLPVVQAFVVSQGHIHICRIGDKFVVHPGPFGDGVEVACVGAGNLLRLVKAHKQQPQEGCVVLQAQPAYIARLLPNPAAHTAVDRTEAILLRFGQLLPVYIHIAEHIRTSSRHDCIYHRKQL